MLNQQVHRHQLFEFLITLITIEVDLQIIHGSTDKPESICCNTEFFWIPLYLITCV